MLFRLLADLTVIVHAAFVAFVVLGGWLALRWPAVTWVHVPAVLWAIWVEWAGQVCPLTPLENWLRARGGGEVYTSSFVDRYLMPALYPDALTPAWQWRLGALVLLVNLAVYAVVLWRRVAARRSARRQER